MEKWNIDIEKVYCSLRTLGKNGVYPFSCLPHMSNLDQVDLDEICEYVDYVKEKYEKYFSDTEFDRDDYIKEAIQCWIEDCIETIESESEHLESKDSF